MKLYHATLKSNLSSIQREGLDPSRSKGAEKVIWKPHTRSRTEWAILHLQKRHRCSIDDIVILTVNVPRGKLKRRWRGLWSTSETIKETFVSITEAEVFASSPIA